MEMQRLQIRLRTGGSIPHASTSNYYLIYSSMEKTFTKQEWENLTCQQQAMIEDYILQEEYNWKSLFNFYHLI